MLASKLTPGMMFKINFEDGYTTTDFIIAIVDEPTAPHLRVIRVTFMRFYDKWRSAPAKFDIYSWCHDKSSEVYAGPRWTQIGGL